MSEFDRDLKHLEKLLDPVLPGAKKESETKFTIRLTDSLKESLKAEAEARGINFSDYVRSKLSGETPPIRRRNRRQVSRIDRSLLVELNRIGINLNQAVRRLNSQAQPRVSQADRQLLSQLLEKLQAVELALISEAKELEEET
ncbi:plasmid mobilization protein [Leptolyngbya sp. NIES-2104]|uniref:plasmid mobilization protein n=1 Tax=Leptolyngbya sp. NIES-2104 TaxID=1552121 RepID=UPI0006EC701E|nr:plasmid mobilization relaxosome protein MobC [Leptolyngbya sp. NIES-2104]GAQ00197.1 hypothetical protein NIES2104_67620 [Leptolyngbya sp. NIES-2104]